MSVLLQIVDQRRHQNRFTGSREATQPQKGLLDPYPMLKLLS